MRLYRSGSQRFDERFDAAYLPEADQGPIMRRISGPLGHDSTFDYADAAHMPRNGRKDIRTGEDPQKGVVILRKKVDKKYI